MDLEALLKECGVALYDDEIVGEHGRTIYRIYIMKPGGVNLDDCERVSKLLSPIFDVKPPVDGEWVLEVSSPGLERKLTKESHFQNSIDELVKIELEDKTKIKGKIVGLVDGVLELLVDEKSVKVKFDTIKKAKTYIEW